jgi:MFS family permease
LGVVPPLVALIGRELGGAGPAGAKLGQLTLVLPFLGLTLGGLVAGSFMERLGLRWGVALAGLAFALCGVTCISVEPSFQLVFFASSFLLGVASACLATGCDLLVASYFEGSGRTKMFGYQTAFGSLLVAVSAYVSGRIADVGGWRGSYGLFIAAGAFTCIAALCVVRTNGADVLRPPRLWDKIGLLLPMASIYGGIFFLTLMAATTPAYIALLVADGIGRSASASSVVIAMQGASCMVTAPLYARVQALIGERWAVALIIALGSAGLLLTGVSHSILSYGIGAGLIGAGVGLSQPFFFSLIVRASPLVVRPQACGLFGTASFLGAFANPFVMTLVRAQFGLHGLYIAAAIASAVIGLVVLQTAGRTTLLSRQASRAAG